MERHSKYQSQSLWQLNTEPATPQQRKAARASPVSRPKKVDQAALVKRAKEIQNQLPQLNLFSKARYPRIARSVWAERALEEYPSVSVQGPRLGVNLDDKRFNDLLNDLQQQYSNEINALRVACERKVQVLSRKSLASFTPRLSLRVGQKVVKPTGETLRELKVRGGAMSLRKAQELARHLGKLSQGLKRFQAEIDQAHHALVGLLRTARRYKGFELLLTAKIAKQINQIRVSRRTEVEGAHSPTPHFQLETLRLHACLVAKAITGHGTVINRMYNVRKRIDRGGYGKARPAALNLTQRNTTTFDLPVMGWALVIRTTDGHYFVRRSVQRTKYSTVHGRLVQPHVEAIADADGHLRMQAVARASLLHMADEYHALDGVAARFNQIVRRVVLAGRALLGERATHAINRTDWQYLAHAIEGGDLQISTLT